MIVHGAVGHPGAVADPVTGGWDADEALEQVYAAHWRSLVRLSMLLVGDLGTAEEVVQDAFVAMHGRWRRLRDPDKALAYLRRTVVNRSRSVQRHRVVVDRELRREAARPQQVGEDAATAAASATRRETVLDALGGLPRRQREGHALRNYLDQSESEIADALGISRGAVKSHASRGAASLRSALSDVLEDLR